jgi:hypothetical protein
MMHENAAIFLAVAESLNGRFRGHMGSRVISSLSFTPD